LSAKTTNELCSMRAAKREWGRNEGCEGSVRRAVMPRPRRHEKMNQDDFR
jgi:hypothetical protein